jgi:ABC-type glycerol-3-phosphate transport system permease component
MTIGNSEGQPKPRSKTNRRFRQAGNRAWVTMFAGALCLLFILPLIYMFSTMVDDPSTNVTPGSPLYPALGRTYKCPSEPVCSYHDGFVTQQVTWDIARTMGPTLATVTSTQASSATSADVTAGLTAKGLVSFGISVPAGGSPVSFSSKEGSNKPQLVVTSYSMAADTEAPSVPSGVTSTFQSDTRIDLTWAASIDKPSTSVTAGYVISRDGAVLATVGSTSWYDTGLTPDTAHSYRISAFDGAGNISDLSTAFAVRTKATDPTVKPPAPDTTPPTAPGAVTVATHSWSSTTVSWTASTDHVISYTISRDNVDPANLTTMTDLMNVDGAETSFVDASAKPWTSYKYIVKATDATGNSTPSAAATFTTPGPTAAEATPVTTTLDAVQDSYVDQANIKTNYGTQATLVASGDANAAKNSYLKFDTSAVPGLIHGATLNLYSTTASTTGYVVASVPDSTWSETTQWVDYPAFASAGTVAPLSPSGVTATWSKDKSDVTVSWTQAADKAAVASYTITRAAAPADGTNPVQVLVSGSTSSFEDYQTTPTSGYTYTVKATDGAGNKSADSSGVTLTTPAPTAYADTTGDTIAPSTPTDLAATAKSATEIDLTWTASTDNNAVVAYRVYRDGTIIATTGSNSWFDTFMDRNSTHVYQVSAIDAAGLESAKTGTVNVTSKDEPVSNVAAADKGWVGEVLLVYTVPVDKLLVQAPAGSSVDLALFVDRSPETGQSVKFIDPATNQVVTSKGPLGTLSLQRHWDFHITLDNFSTANAWADQITSSDVTSNSLGGMLIGNGFLRMFFNTFVVAGLGTIGATLSAILVGYGFARFKIPGRDILFMVLIGTILLPFQVTLIPQFIMFQAIGWIGTWLPLIIPTYFANAYNVFLLRQYFLTLPRELDEAAMMDGATPFRILISVIIPQSWPAIISVMLFHFFFAWNDFLAPLVFLSGRKDLWTIALGLNQFNAQFQVSNGPPAIMAGAFLSLLLPVAIFFVAQKVFMRGVVISGVEK